MKKSNTKLDNEYVGVAAHGDPKGITLIALVITIIVLIILAGVAINLTLGDNGILRRAQDAQKLADEATVKEKIEIAVLDVQIEEVEQTGRLTHKKLSEVLESKDSNITLNQYTEGDTILTGTYLYEGKEYGFTIDENFKVIIGEVEEAVPQPVTFGEITWESGKASITLSTTLEGIIEYQVNGTVEGSWAEGTTVSNLNNGDKVYARVNDGTTTTEAQEKEIKDTILPEEFTITVSEDTVTYEALTISSTGTTDNQTGIKNYSFVITTNGAIAEEIKEQTVTEYPVEGLSPETEYVVYMLAYDNAGNSRKSNEVTVTTSGIPVVNMIGQPVNYSANGITDWKVFYGYDDGEIFLIKSDYLNKSKIPSAAMMNSSSALQQRAFWTTSVTYDNIIDTDTTIRSRFLMSYNKSTTNINIKCVSKLLNTTTWSAFANGTSGDTQISESFAIGSPTLEMFVASWNSLHPDKKITINKTESNNGFSISYSEKISSTDWGTLYRTSNTAQVNALNGYFIACPSTNSYNYIWTFDWRSDSKLSSEDATNCSHTARPVVSIPAKYKLQWNSETSKYDIVEK